MAAGRSCSFNQAGGTLITKVVFFQEKDCITKELSIYCLGNKGKDGICTFLLNDNFIAQEGDNLHNYFLTCSGRW